MNVAVWLIWLAAMLLMAVFGQTPALRWLLMLLPFCFAASALVTWLASRSLTLSVKVKEGGGKKQDQRPNPQRGVAGGIVEQELPIEGSNVAIYNPKTQKADRIGFRVDGDKKVRFFKSTGDVVGV